MCLQKFLFQTRKERVLVLVVLVNGQNFQGLIKNYDDKVILFDVSGDVLVYKHAIASIEPAY
jgi:host factor-I protein